MTSTFCPDCGKPNVGIHTCSPQFSIEQQQKIENKVKALLADLAIYKADSKRYQLLKSGKYNITICAGKHVKLTRDNLKTFYWDENLNELDTFLDHDLNNPEFG